LPAPADALTRWLNYLFLALSLGSLAFGLLVWKPACRQEQTPPGVEEAVIRGLRRLSLVGLAGLGLACVGLAAVQLVLVRPSLRGLSSAAPVVAFASSRTGVLLIVRLALAAALAWIVFHLPAAAKGPAREWWWALLLGAGILLTFSLQSHSAARSSVIGVVADSLHLAAMVVWLGGLPASVIALRQGRSPELTVTLRLSVLALLSTVVLALSGLYSALLLIRTREALAATSYGRTFTAKMVLFGLLVCFLILSPGLHRSSRKARTWLIRLVLGATVVGTVLLASVGLLTAISPALEALEARNRQGFVQSTGVDGVRMTLRIAPGRVGDNEFGVELARLPAGDSGAAPQVLLRLSCLSMDMGTQEVEATSLDGRRYTARGSYLSMSGRWRIEAIVRREGFNDARHAYELQVGGESGEHHH
jgi:putative copper export protein